NHSVPGRRRQGARIGGMAAMPIAGAGGIDLVTAFQAAFAAKMEENPLVHGGTADVSQADEQDFRGQNSSISRRAASTSFRFMRLSPIRAACTPAAAREARSELLFIPDSATTGMPAGTRGRSRKVVAREVWKVLRSRLL